MISSIFIRRFIFSICMLSAMNQAVDADISSNNTLSTSLSVLKKENPDLVGQLEKEWGTLLKRTDRPSFYNLTISQKILALGEFAVGGAVLGGAAGFISILWSMISLNPLEILITLFLSIPINVISGSLYGCLLALVSKASTSPLHQLNLSDLKGDVPVAFILTIVCCNHWLGIMYLAIRAAQKSHQFVADEKALLSYLNSILRDDNFSQEDKAGVQQFIGALQGHS